VQEFFWKGGKVKRCENPQRDRNLIGNDDDLKELARALKPSKGLQKINFFCL